MAENKSLFEKKILILVIILFALILAIGLAYFSSLNNVSPVAVEPTVIPIAEPTVMLTPEPTKILTPAVIPAATDSFAYGKNDDVFSLSENKFKVLDKFSVSGLIGLSVKCRTNKSEQYFKQLLSNYSNNDNGTEYHFTYTKEDSRDWIITVIPNKIGYVDLADFKKDFDVCEVGADRYPLLISENYLLFTMSCRKDFEEPDWYAIGCDFVREIIEPTIKLK